MNLTEIVDSVNTVAVPVSASDQVVKAGRGVLCRVIVTTDGANPLTIYDNATAGSGLIIGQLKASPGLGVFIFDVPVRNGITVKGSATNPAVTISFV